MLPKCNQSLLAATAVIMVVTGCTATRSDVTESAVTRVQDAPVYSVTINGPRLVLRTGAVHQDFVAVPAGQFRFGDETADVATRREKSVSAFWIADTETTRALWSAVMTPGVAEARATSPMAQVSWNDCQRFIDALNVRCVGSGWRFRLPSEVEWEYACRAGSTGPFGGPDVEMLAWHSGNSGYRIHPVASKSANAWGLYDCHGNVREWCADVATDPQTGIAYDGGVYRILRGGDSASLDWDCRSSSRWWSRPELTDSRFGMRLVAEPAR